MIPELLDGHKNGSKFRETINSIGKILLLTNMNNCTLWRINTKASVSSVSVAAYWLQHTPGSRAAATRTTFYMWRYFQIFKKCTKDEMNIPVYYRESDLYSIITLGVWLEISMFTFLSKILFNIHKGMICEINFLSNPEGEICRNNMEEYI